MNLVFAYWVIVLLILFFLLDTRGSTASTTYASAGECLGF